MAAGFLYVCMEICTDRLRVRSHALNLSLRTNANIKWIGLKLCTAIVQTGLLASRLKARETILRIKLIYPWVSRDVAISPSTR